MFGLAFFLLFFAGCLPFLRTVGRYAQARSAGRTPFIPMRRWSAGLLLIAADAAALGLLAYTWDTWGEVLWFEELGQGDRFWTVFWAKIVLFAVPFALLLPGCSLCLRSVYRRCAQQYPAIPYACGLLLALLFATPVSAHWAPILAYLNQVSVAGSPADPIFGKAANFYLFDLGLYRAAYVWLLWLLSALLLAGGLLVVLGSAVTAMADAASRSGAGGPGRDQELVFPRAGTAPVDLKSVAPHLFALVALLLFASAWGFQLEKYGLMYSTEGVVRGAGYTDHQVRVPMYDLMTLVDLLLGAACLAATGLRRLRDWCCRRRQLIGMVAARLLLSALSLWAVPNLVYRLNVKNNEVTLESPYIEHNIRMTRAAYNIDAASMTEKEFVLEPELTREVMDANQNTLKEVRLWDYRALHAVLMQTQKVQMYYHFYDVDVDRYRTSKGYHQVMLAARELDMSRVPQRWVNTTLQYTHGYGLVMNPVNVFLPNGNPEFWVSDVAPVKVTVPELELQRPAIYYGERTDSHVYTNTTQQEFDYPTGDSNAYTTYTGTGGVRLSSLWRKLVFGWKFDSHRILMSSYFTDDSRILFRRSIRERVSRLAPFLTLDRDEYPVNYGGRILWICDAYTTSTMYPYSEPYRGTVASLQGISYIRNSVKAVVDAYDGSVDLYVFDEQDPMVATWGRVFPGLLKRAAQMPAGLREHIRYPIDLFRVQAEVYCKYHMNDPQLYYNNGDLWELSKELIANDPVPIEPYYVIVQMPGMDAPEFILMEPFTQATNPRMTGWMAGLCDGERYGKLVVYLFPKGHYVPGTLQIEGKISSDEVISAQLMQWNMKGSEVVRGHLLVIPLIGNRVVCFEPIYLQASAQGAKIPTLTRVVAVHVKPDNDMRIKWGGTYLESQAALLGDGAPAATVLGGRAGSSLSVDEVLRLALERLTAFKHLFGEGKFQEAGSDLKVVFELLQQRAGSGSDSLRRAGVQEGTPPSAR
jgi:uncharacterized membrane protein (UPF0182 family)